MNYLLLLVATIIAILPVLLIKKYIVTHNKMFLIIALFSYILLLVAYLKLFKTDGADISTIYTLLQILQILVVYFVGIFYFNEKTNLNKIVGTGFGIISIYFLLKK
jgi:multidrug transporter EmrE-like cation transporter